METLILKLFGFKALFCFGDSTGFDRFNWLKKHFKHKSNRVLDAGCGSGSYTFYAAGLSKEAFGISFDENNTKKAVRRVKVLNIKNIKFIQSDLREISKISSELGLFDQIICFETIEHIKDDKKLISEFSSLLIKGGMLYLTTPYKYYKHLIGDKLSKVEDGGHVRWGYTHEEIRKIFSGCEIAVIEEEFVSGFISQQICNLQRILSKVFGSFFGWLLSFPFRIFQVLDRPLTALLNYPYLSIAVIGIKK